MKEEVEHSNPLKGLSQKTSIILKLTIKKKRILTEVGCFTFDNKIVTQYTVIIHR